jgi:hypothetical protein
MSIPKIAYCVMTGDKPQHISGCLQNLLRIKPFVDYLIVVYDFLSEQNFNLLKEYEPIFIKLPFNQYPNGYRNAYLNKARELDCDYVFVTDTDELPDLLLCSELKSIIVQNPMISQFRINQKYNLINNDKLDAGELSPYSEKFCKGMIFKLEPWYFEPGAIEPVTEKNPKLIDFDDWHVLNLPEKYFFTHTKSAEDVWYGAVRDFHLGQWNDIRGGKELTGLYNEFMSLIENRDWPSLLNYFKVGNIDSRIKDFIIRNRSSQFTELRSLFKFYFVYLHPEENTDKLISEFVPKEQSKIEAIVQNAYLTVFHRHPDNSGLKTYSQLLENGQLTPETLIMALKASQENLVNELDTGFVNIFNRIPTSLEYLGWSFLYQNGIVTNVEKVLQTLVYEKVLTSQRIAYCQMCHAGDFKEALKNAINIKSYVDETILIYDQSLSIEQIKQIKDAGIFGSYSRWHDNFPDQRNYYLQLARQRSCGWVFVSDPDEHHDDFLVKNIRAVIQAGQANNFGVMQIRSHDCFTDDDDGKDLEQMNEIVSKDYWKGLLFKLTPEVQYVGVGETKNLHEFLQHPGPRVNLQEEFFYRHIKSHKEIWEHAARNLFVSGGGDNIGTQNPDWTSLRKICDNLNLKTWKELKEYLIKGNIDKSLKDWIIAHRNDWRYNYHSEHREFFKWYFYILHPEENTDNLKVDAKPNDEDIYPTEELVVMRLYRKHLSRDPDLSGLRHYSQKIKEGSIKPEQLEQALINSEEYHQKWPQGKP